MRTFHNHFIGVVIGLIFSGCHSSDNQLEESFKSPPDVARPGVYWYFMDGNQSREAMTADLQAMHKAGLRKALFLEVNIGVPRGPVDFMSEEWQDNFVHAVKTADQLGMEIILGTGPGWSGAGGPWIDPARSMQHLRSSSVQVQGPGHFSGTLPVPGPRAPAHFAGLSDTLAKIRNAWYANVAVLAFPTPDINDPPEMLDVKNLDETQPYSIWKQVPRYIPSRTEYPEPPKGAVIDKSRITDLTSLMQPDGSLEWEIPGGQWTIMRFAARSTGATTRPAPTPGHGFETDKFNAEAFAFHFQQFHQKLLGKIGPQRPGRGWTGLHLDSWEMSSQNWSANFRDQFLKRRGYDPQPFYPAYTGLLVDSREKTERFLWDLRKTAQELVIENHSMVIRDYAHQNGLYYSNEPYDMNPAGDIELGAVADIPGCEFWTAGPDAVYSCTEAVSIAHTMGLPVIRAEAFTSTAGYQHNPADLKNQTDWAFAAGINDIIIHTWQHQPLGIDSPKPGMAMGSYGVNWHRNQTFWPMVKPYHDYIARCSYLLRQGISVADILYLTPEGAPHIFLPPEDAMTSSDRFRDKKGYNFDAVSPGILMSRAEVKDGQIVFPGGTTYRILVLPLIKTMTPGLLGKLEELIRQGITVVGIPPVKSPSLAGYPDCDKEVASLAEIIWSGRKVPGQISEIAYGKGRIIWGGESTLPSELNALYPSFQSTAQLLTNQSVNQIFESTVPLRFHQRQTDHLDIFFVSNKDASPVDASCIFRTRGKAPELWDPVTGHVRPLLQYTIEKPRSKAGVDSESVKGLVVFGYPLTKLFGDEPTGNQDETVALPLHFESYQSYFVVFHRTKGSSLNLQTGQNFPGERNLCSIGGPWNVTFDPKWGGQEETVIFDSLKMWNEHQNEAIRFYSGEAVYQKTFNMPDSLTGNSPVSIDLGVVHKLAKVKLNGEELGIVWTPPYQVDVTGKLKPVDNQLEITVVNTWVNRLVGDLQPVNRNVRQLQWASGLLEGKSYPAGRYTFTTFYGPYNADSPLQESGLAGPVRIMGYIP